MRACVQRVRRASVSVDGEVTGEIGRGLLVLLGVMREDDESDLQYLVEKITTLRIFEDENGKMNLSLLDIGGELLVVSQFTLYGDCRKGRRPSFIAAADPVKGKQMYDDFVRQTAQRGIKVATGRFQAMMDVALVNEGPVTILLDSRKTF